MYAVNIIFINNLTHAFKNQLVIFCVRRIIVNAVCKHADSAIGIARIENFFGRVAVAQNVYVVFGVHTERIYPAVNRDSVCFCAFKQNFKRVK